MKDMLETSDCPMCAANQHALKCTLHGGHMTATEVRMRDKYAVVDDRWVQRTTRPDPLEPYFRDQIDRTFEILRKEGLLPKPPMPPSR